MSSRYETAKDLGFQESQPGLLNWFVKESGLTIFLDFRSDDGGNDFNGDMPPRIYAADEDDEGDTLWINDSGDTKERWKDEIKGHWVVEKVEEESGLDSDRGQSTLGWYSSDGVEERACDKCDEMFPVSDLEDSLCFGDDTNGCYYDENPSELFRQAKRRKEKLRSDRDR